MTIPRDINGFGVVLPAYRPNMTLFKQSLIILFIIFGIYYILWIVYDIMSQTVFNPEYGDPKFADPTCYDADSVKKAPQMDLDLKME